MAGNYLKEYKIKIVIFSNQIDTKINEVIRDLPHFSYSQHNILQLKVNIKWIKIYEKKKNKLKNSQLFMVKVFSIVLDDIDTIPSQSIQHTHIKWFFATLKIENFQFSLAKFIFFSSHLRTLLHTHFKYLS